MAETSKPLGVIEAFGKVLLFQATENQILGLGWKHLAFGLISTWLVGMGRYWDSPRAEPLQHLGLGSVIYVFLLAAFLWLVVRPLKPKNWTYFNLLIYITLTSPPAALYALPVEKWIGLDAAIDANLNFLWIVATWRVALLVRYLFKVAELRGITLITAATGPIFLILFSLTALNLHKVVFDFMGGFHHRPGAEDAAYGSLVVVTLVTYAVSIPLAVIYIILVFRKHTLLQRLWRTPKKVLALCLATVLMVAALVLALVARISAPVQLADTGERFLYQDNLQKALQIANECITRYPYSAEGYSLRANILQKQGQRLEALANFENAFKHAGGGLDSNAIRALQLCAETGQWDRARQFIHGADRSESLKLKEADIFAFVNNHDAELKVLNEAVQSSESNQGNAPESELVSELAPPPKDKSYYQEAIDLSKALEARAVAQIRQGKVDEAVQDARRSVRLYPDSDSRFLLGVALIKANQRKDGAAVLETLLLEKPIHTAEDFWRRGRIQWASGKYTEAMKSYGEALELLPKAGTEQDFLDGGAPPDESGTEVALLLEGALLCRRAGDQATASTFLQRGLQRLTQVVAEPRINVPLARALLFSYAGDKEQCRIELEQARKIGYRGQFPPPAYYRRLPSRQFQSRFFTAERQSPSLVFVPVIFWSTQ